ncbi:uncharacterized protein TRAVEDRAFT_53147 [Trametes versicolor FP-101664 SS1]|uniref:uncharacterized protein n=1 Tax=Trametes versicolor (strain FP-101664) TaxID=717944 RepID=UPI0004621887|nr:uncharacterized protein TRAVEDRAFT_53147 [Trametes versicolor FP-101664 SS1]EIW52707.1 hypothetical protein TRAVEDRAFT_53147 [Trametes versicolor FP-101664 SS1]
MASIFQNAFYIGNNFNTIFYGIELAVYVLTIRALRHPGRRSSSMGDMFLVLFSTVLLLLNTIFVATEAVFGEEMWIVNADYPGGQNAYLVDFASVWYQTFGTAASILLNLLSDAFLIYRCYIVWADLRIILFPSVLYLATFALGIAQLVASGIPHADYFAGFAQKLGTAYTSTIIALEIIVTALIYARLLRLARTCGSSAAARRYTSGAAIFIESMALSTLCGIAYLVPYAMGSDISIFFLSVYVMSTCLAPMLIILRMTSGRAWTRHTTVTIFTTTSGSEYPTATDTARTLGGDATTTAIGKDEEAGYSPTDANPRS